LGGVAKVEQASACLGLNFARLVEVKGKQAEQVAEKVDYFVILSGAKNLS